MKVETTVKASVNMYTSRPNHSQTPALRIRTGVKAGGISINHNQTRR
jgi:hypothetical protein